MHTFFNIYTYIFFIYVCSASTVSGQVFIDVKAHGAKGDGKSNDYYALLKVVDLVNKNRGGEVYFPPGTYYIDAYNNGNGPAALEFKNGNGLKISGKDAKISVKGNFHRSITKKEKYTTSKISAIIPIKISNYTNVVIEELEIDGNVDQTTRDPGVMESSGHLIMISNSSKIKLRNLYLHHGQTDGLYIYGNSSDIEATRVISSNNARQGMSIIGLRNSKFTDCKFINTGFTGGNYGHHSPGAGVDIEPHNIPGGMNVKSVTFLRCDFSNNIGSQFVCTSPEFTTDISLIDCSFVSNKESSRYTVILAARNVIVDNANIDCKKGDVFAIWPQHPNSTVTIKNSTIRSAQSGIQATNVGVANRVLIIDNQLIYTGDAKSFRYFPYLQNKNLKFINNEIIIPSKAIVNSYSKDHSLIQNAIESRGNKFRTENPAIKPRVNYNRTILTHDKK